MKKKTLSVSRVINLAVVIPIYKTGYHCTPYDVRSLNILCHHCILMVSYVMSVYLQVSVYFNIFGRFMEILSS